MKKTVIIKIGGRVLENGKSLDLFGKSVKRLASRYNLLIVHGGGAEVSSWLERLGIKYRFVDGQRYTSREAAVVVEMVLSGKVNKFLVSALNAKKIAAAGISLRDASTAVSKRIEKLGCVGEPYKVNVSLVKHLFKGGFIPVVSTMSEDAYGNALNVNADAVCPMLAKALKADNLVYLTDVDGVLGADSAVIKTIRAGDIGRLISSNVIKGGMIPKIKSAAGAVINGVRRIDIINGNKGINLGSGTKIIR